MAKPPIYNELLIWVNQRLGQTFATCIDLDGDRTNLLRMYQFNRSGQSTSIVAPVRIAIINDGLVAGYTTPHQRSTAVQPNHSSCIIQWGSQNSFIEDAMLWNRYCLIRVSVRYPWTCSSSGVA